LRASPTTRRSHRDPPGRRNHTPGETITTIHAWFSFESALVHGSPLFRKPGGDTVNVTRTNVERNPKARSSDDEKYVGEVIRSEDGGCVRSNHRVDGITGSDHREPAV